MKTISVSKFCVNYDIPQQFIDSLSKYDLVKVIEVETTKHIHIDDINRIERLMRIHFDLDVNFEGLDIINNLIDQINTLQNEVSRLKSRLELYE